MPITVDAAASMLSIVSSVGSMLQTYVSMRHTGSKEVPSKELFESEFLKKNDILQPTAEALAKSLNQNISDVLLEKINEIEQKIIETIRSDVSISEKDSIISGQKRAYCWYLKELKLRLKGQLPPPLQGEWEVNSCENYSF